MYNTKKPYTDGIRRKIQSTWGNSDRFIVAAGPLGCLFKRREGYTGWEVDHVDGIGTKGYYHWRYRTWKEAAQDALAMNVNDLLMFGAVPVKLEAHLTLPAEDTDAIECVTDALVDFCVQNRVVYTGGETSIQDTCEGIDISVGMTGLVDRPMENMLGSGDVLLGFASSGLHSNGFTLVRRSIPSTEQLTVPTRIYFSTVAPVLNKVRGVMHITGGAYSKLLTILPDNCQVRLDALPLPQRIFWDLYHSGISAETMYSAFNCGVGMVVSVRPNDVNELVRLGAVPIGTVEGGTKAVIIDSRFDNSRVVLQ